MGILGTFEAKTEFLVWWREYDFAACLLAFIHIVVVRTVVYIGSTRVAITRIKKEIKTHAMAHLANCALFCRPIITVSSLYYI